MIYLYYVYVCIYIFVCIHIFLFFVRRIAQTQSPPQFSLQIYSKMILRIAQYHLLSYSHSSQPTSPLPPQPSSQPVLLLAVSSQSQPWNNHLKSFENKDNPRTNH